MDQIIDLSKKLSRPALRISLGIVLLWIGALKFADPTPVVGLLDASLPFLASTGFVYFMGVLEVAVGALFVINKALIYAALFSVGLFVGTIFIFVIAPAVAYGDAGFPLLTLAGEFLLKDIVLLAASLTIISQK